ncbi:MAG: dTDP-4-dehydrorhamnose reductase [Frankiales bacterium]|nr:dTDP-4-dehydrorhamnose reductase [Frankiales bacterium]
MTVALLITGVKGQLGSEISRQALRASDIPFARGIDLPEVDLTDPFAVRDTVEEWARVVRSDSPAHKLVVVNPAAYTAVDQAEEQEELAYAVNAAAPALLATACGAVGAGLIHLSTDYVFPGDGTVPYEPEDPKGPTNAYGRTKLAGEQALREILPQASWIVRTAWLYGAGGPNFVKTMARLEKTKDTVSVITDQVGSPTWAGDLAGRLLDLARSDAPAGAYHGTNRGQTSWHGFAKAVFEELGADPARVLETDAASYVTAATRPAYSVLSPAAWDGAGLPPFLGWREALAEAFRVEGDALRAG